MSTIEVKFTVNGRLVGGGRVVLLPGEFLEAFELTADGAPITRQPLHIHEGGRRYHTICNRFADIDEIEETDL